MKKTTAILAVTVAVIVVLAAFASIYLTQTMPTKQLPSGEPAQWQIKVTGHVNQQKTWTLKEMSKMPLTEVNVKGENATYLGVTLSEFCNQSGMLWDTGQLNIIGVDGQSAALNVFQAWNSTSYPYHQDSNVIVLAFVKDGEWLTSEEGGPVRLIAPYFSAKTQVAGVTEVHVEPWTVKVRGEVANPLVLTGGNLTVVQSKTVHGDFRPGGSPNRTSDWTGLPILELLEAAGVRERAERVSIVGVDGYVKNYTLVEVGEGAMMIGFQENGEFLPLSEGGPYRLFAPTDRYKWGQFWVKFVKEIIVS